MRLHASYLAMAAVALGFMAQANATIVGSTYNFSTSQSGDVVIDPLGPQGSFTDPANPGFCVGSIMSPPTCAMGQGVSGSFAFAHSTPTLDTITFTFFGAAVFAFTGSFSIDLGNFVTTDGETITGVTYDSGNFNIGDFSTVTWNGTDAVFTGNQVESGFSGLGGVNIVFDVTTSSAAVPEPTSLALLTGAILGLGAIRLRRSVALRRC